MARPSDFGGLFSAGRIVVTGANGAGKSVFADALVAARGLPLFRNDALVLMQNWQRRPEADVMAARAEIAMQDAWVIEGGPSLLQPGPIRDRAELVVWLDLPRVLRCWRIMRRTLRFRGLSRPDLPAGNREAFDRRNWQFLRKAWRNHGAAQQAVREGVGDLPVVHLSSQADVRSAMAALS